MLILFRLSEILRAIYVAAGAVLFVLTTRGERIKLYNIRDAFSVWRRTPRSEQVSSYFPGNITISFNYIYYDREPSTSSDIIYRYYSFHRSNIMYTDRFLENLPHIHRAFFPT